MIPLGAGCAHNGRIITSTEWPQRSERVITCRSASITRYRFLHLDVRRNQWRRRSSCARILRPRDRTQVLASTLTEMDPKVGRIWFMEEAGISSGQLRPRRGIAGLGGPVKNCGGSQVARMQTIPVRSCVNEQVWEQCPVAREASRAKDIYGIDLPLQAIWGFNRYGREQNPHSRSYAILLTPRG